MIRLGLTLLTVWVIGSYLSLLQADTGMDGIKTLLPADDVTIVKNGSKIYQAQCAACHGVALEGQPNWQGRDASGRLPAPPHDETGHTWHHADDLLFEMTKYGPGVAVGLPDYQTNMPAYEEILGDDEIIAVLSYIKSTWPQQERERQDSMTAAKPGEDAFFDQSIAAYMAGKSDSVQQEEELLKSSVSHQGVHQ